MPRAPFAVGLAAAVVAFGAALDMADLAEERIVEAEELASPTRPVYSEFTMEEAEVEVVEYGFSAVTVDGEGWILVGAVVRNPHDETLFSGQLSVTGVAEDGDPIRAEDFGISYIPAGGTISVGHVMRGNATDLPLDDLRVESLTPAYLDTTPGDADDAEGDREAPPEVALLGVEPLASPDGYRVSFDVSPGAGALQLSLMFRDGEGRLLGGVPVESDPFGTGLTELGWIDFRSASTAEYMDLHESWIPEGADLDAIEIGPSGYPGG